MIFQNREEAGKKLAERLIEYKNRKPVVLAIPRGGLVTAFPVAEDLNAQLDLIIPRKLGAPANPELAIGAVTQDGNILLNPELVEKFQISQEEIFEEAEIVIEEIKRRLELYRGNNISTSLEKRTVILIDDGIATGFTILAALNSIKSKKPREVILAVPVAASSIVEQLEKEVDKVICLSTPQDFYAVGQFYQEFEQVTDDEVINIMRKTVDKALNANV